MLDRDGIHLLVEAKTVGANAEHAVREAIGQLFTYQFLYYPAGTNKVALFSSPIGDLWVSLLQELSIDSIWLAGSSWQSAGSRVDWV